MEITDISNRYEYIKNRNVNCFLVNHDLLFKFFNQKIAIDPVLRDASNHDKYALSLKILLNYLAFEYANCPLFLDSDFYYRDNRLEKIKGNIRMCQQSYIEIADQLGDILKTLEDLKLCGDNPLLENIEKNIGYNDAALMLINPDHSQAVLEMCEDFGIGIKVSSPNTSGIIPSQKGIFCGCAKFFPAHTFWSPEFKELHLVRFAWFFDYIRSHHQIHGQAINSSPPALVIKKKDAVPVQVFEKPIELTDPAKDFDISMLGRYRSKDQDQGSFDNVEAKVVVLRGGKFVFLPADDDYKHHCITNLDVLDRGPPAVKKIAISEFNQYTAILLRERERGDYVADIANTILGSRAELFRSHQHQWKNALREQINSVGITELSKELSRAGCKTAASYQNLRNWASARFIRPHDSDDFNCLLKFLGLENEAPALIRSMGKIRAAHRAAGHRISQQLRQLAQNDNNLKGILTDGYRIYRTEGGGKLGVYIFDRVLDEKISVSYADTGGVKNLEAVYG